MRIIAGEHRGRTLFAPKGTDTRPTRDRVRESLFSILQTRIAGARVLDLFAGSGALGLEALSRGAEKAVFADNDRGAQEAVQRNIQALRAGDQTALLRTDWQEALRRLQAAGETFDLIFLDPPYKFAQARAMLDALCADALLARNALVIYEHAAALPPDTAGWHSVDIRRYGDTAIAFLSRDSEGGGDAESAVSGQL